MSKCVLLKVNQCLIILFLYVIFPCSSFSQCVDNGNVDNKNSSNNVFHSIDEIDASVCDFCENIFRQFKLLNFRIFPFYMQSFFYPKASLMSAKGLIPVPKGDELLSADFKSMMAQYKNKQNILSSEYGATYYGVHRHNMDSMCIYYEQMGNCVKQCLPIPPLKRPVLEEKDGKLITKFHIRKAVDSTMDSSTNAQYKYHDVVEEMNLEKLKSTVGESVEIVKAEMGDHYDLKTEKIDDTKVSPNQNVNVKCISGLEFPGKRYYIKKYDKTIGGHRYFWVRLNKKKLVRHIYDDQKNRYLPCDDSFSYDIENILMESFLKSIELHGDYYVIRNQQGNKYSGHVKQNLCRNSELYFYTSNYSKEIKDDKECIFGNIEYLSDNGKKVKHCLYKYTSDDFQTFGISRNVYELNKTDVFLTNKEELDGLIEENLYFQGMCVQKFPKYDYSVQRHANGEVEKQYVYEIDRYNQCNFLKIEAWGGGQAGDVEYGKAYNGTPGHYTLAVLDPTKVKNKKLMIYVGEGGKFPGQYGEDTVVAVCDNSNFDKCEIVLLARGCTTGECEEKHSLIKDDIVVHYRSATGMSFPKEMYNFRQYDKFIPWGSSYDFLNGTMGLSYQDCHGPVNSWEKNDKYPGSGGCARVGKSIQQGADGMVKVTCEQWKATNSNDNNKYADRQLKTTNSSDSNKDSMVKVTCEQLKTTNSSDSNKYSYCDEQLCRIQSGQQECIKGICIYALNENYKTVGRHEAIAMFGDKDACKTFTVENGYNNTRLLSDLDSAKDDVNIHYIGNNITEENDNIQVDYVSERDITQEEGYFCYIKVDKSGAHDSTYSISTMGRLFLSGCREKGDWPLLSCYMDKRNGDDKLYKCCYDISNNRELIDDKELTDNVCWKTSGSDIVQMFNHSSIPQDKIKDFNEVVDALKSSIPSKRQLQSHSTNTKEYTYNNHTKSFGMLVPKTRQLNYIYDTEKKTFCLNITDNRKNKGCLKTVSVCTKSSNTVDKYNSYKLSYVPTGKSGEEKNSTNLSTSESGEKSKIVSWSDNMCDFNHIRQDISKESLSSGIMVSCKDNNGQCCYSNKNGDNNTRNKKEMCLDDENVGLSCYGEKQDPKQEFRHSYYKYYCCYHDLTKPKQGSGQQSVCWSSAQEDIWEILGFYNMSPEKRKELKDKDENYRKHLVVNKELKKTGEQRLPAR
ncbi:hypothetical protein [Ehrlichia ruminantium]|uniref:hypothetical protein n=1 Tax=Ehrlichia ruminantium TaxID=779 RepID=UPI00080B2746|nr:hypothetical protein [Ehrlichia ruminantium]QLK52725.1 hypothetical protein FDZ65_04450 [Ehrlichia ruminantium]QLK54559.1 hypothetical protein FDZ63_04455 [Ehrlichia ruminantium]